MTFRVEITAQAEAELRQAYHYIKDDAPDAAEALRRGLKNIAESLEHFPFRCNKAPEDARTDFEVRQLLYSSYRILFTIIGDRVFILHVMHTARRALLAHQIENPLQ